MAHPGSWIAFDFDGTLTRSDTLIPFLREVIGVRRLVRSLAMEAPWLAGYAVGMVTNDVAKQRLLSRTLRGWSKEQLETQGAAFAQDHIPGKLRPETMQRLCAHREAGNRCVLVTASLTLYTRPWGLAQGFEAVIGSELDFDEHGQATGRLRGANCIGAEKERRLRALLGTEPLCAAYGDSRGDREMLAMAEEAYRVGLCGAKATGRGKSMDMARGRRA